MPFIGAVADDTDQDRARFIKGSDRGKGEAALVEQYGPRGMVGAETERRYLEDRAAKESALSAGLSPLQIREMAADADFAARGGAISELNVKSSVHPS